MYGVEYQGMSGTFSGEFLQKRREDKGSRPPKLMDEAEKVEEKREEREEKGSRLPKLTEEAETREEKCPYEPTLTTDAETGLSHGLDGQAPNVPMRQDGVQSPVKPPQTIASQGPFTVHRL